MHNRVLRPLPNSSPRRLCASFKLVQTMQTAANTTERGSVCIWCVYKLLNRRRFFKYSFVRHSARHGSVHLPESAPQCTRPPFSLSWSRVWYVSFRHIQALHHLFPVSNLLFYVGPKNRLPAMRIAIHCNLGSRCSLCPRCRVSHHLRRSHRCASRRDHINRISHLSSCHRMADHGRVRSTTMATSGTTVETMAMTAITTMAITMVTIPSSIRRTAQWFRVPVCSRRMAMALTTVGTTAGTTAATTAGTTAAQSSRTPTVGTMATMATIPYNTRRTVRWCRVRVSNRQMDTVAATGPTKSISQLTIVNININKLMIRESPNTKMQSSSFSPRSCNYYRNICKWSEFLMSLSESISARDHEG